MLPLPIASHAQGKARYFPRGTRKQMARLCAQTRLMSAQTKPWQKLNTRFWIAWVMQPHDLHLLCHSANNNLAFYAVSQNTWHSFCSAAIDATVLRSGWQKGITLWNIVVGDEHSPCMWWRTELIYLTMGSHGSRAWLEHIHIKSSTHEPNELNAPTPKSEN